MAQRRTERTVLCLEPTLEKLLQEHAKQLTPSEYIRKILIDRFKEDGTLTDKMLYEMVS